MSRFYVGQLVKCVRKLGAYRMENVTPCREVQLGDILIICGTVSQPNEGFNPHGLFDVSARLIDCDLFGMAPSCCLEPATDCYDKTTWDKCVWKPNRQEVTL